MGCCSLGCLFAAFLLAPTVAAAAAAGWQTYDEDKGARFERRDVAGSSYPELRVTKDVSQAPAKVLDVIWRRISDMTSTEDHMKKLIRASPDELVAYQQISVTLISNRDYTVRIWKTPPRADGTLEIRYRTANELGPPVNPDYVRLDAIYGSWTLQPLPTGGTRLSYLAYSEAGGSVPASFARGAQRDRHAADFWAVVERLP